MNEKELEAKLNELIKTEHDRVDKSEWGHPYKGSKREQEKLKQEIIDASRFWIPVEERLPVVPEGEIYVRIIFKIDEQYTARMNWNTTYLGHYSKHEGFVGDGNFAFENQYVSHYAYIPTLVLPGSPIFPCPFCETKEESGHLFCEDVGENAWAIVCENCGYMSAQAATEAEAIEAHNRMSAK